MRSPLLVVVVVAVFGAGACGGADEEGGSATTEVWCRTVERMVEYLDELAGSQLESRQDVIDRRADLESIREDVEVTAPESIADDVETLFEISPDTIHFDEQETRAAADERVNRYIRDECRLDVKL